MRNVLITGAAGFIGSRLAIRLAKAGGVRVIALVNNLGAEHEQELFDAGCVIELGSISDYDRVRNVLSAHDIDTVFHLAAYAIVRLSAMDPMSAYDVNVNGTVSLLEACRVFGGVKKIVVASSDKAYGDHEKLPYTEEHPLQPKNTYDTSKACMDMISRSYAHNYSLPVVVTRCSNVYGPGDRNWNRLIPNTVRRVLNGTSPMLYSDIELGVREFIYIDDVVDAFVSLAETGEETNGKAYNVGGTEAFVIRDLVGVILNVMGSDLKPVVIPRDPIFKEIMSQYIDSSLLQATTGWKPKTDIIDGLQKTVEWVKWNS